MYLNCHSYYSLRYGTMSLETLVLAAKGLGIESLCLTDINNSTGMIDFVKICKEHGIKPFGGIEIALSSPNQGETKGGYVCIAHNNEGFRELNEFVSEHNIEKKNYPDRPPLFPNAHIIYMYGSISPDELRENEWIGVRINDLNRFRASEYTKYQHRFLLWHPVTFERPAGYYLHQNLRAISKNALISKLNHNDCSDPNEYLLPPDQLREIYKDFPQLIYNSERIANDCKIDFDYKSIKNRTSFTGSRYDDKILLEKLAMDGFSYRYSPTNKKAYERLLHELRIIDQLGFSAYFLITWDIIRYSMARGFYHVGRGSGANSIVAYCLKITDVDPIDLDLYFERFINPKRTSPPDFDIDYSWTDREEVQEYIFKRYGYKHTALLGTITTFRGKSIFRELGKVYGLPKNEIDELIANPGHEVNRNEITQQIFQIARLMVDFPNIRSIHAGGILISEEPITCYTALDMPPKGFQTTQWDMYVAEDIRFEKLDILSQRGIGHIKEAADIIRANKGVDVDVHDVERFKKDEKVKYQLKTAETNGCFYIESPAMRGLLKKLMCDNYLTLVAASSIIRPGVSKSGMMREYIHRFHHPDDFEYMHPIMEEQLSETYGVMVYQEDVLKICHHFADLDLSDADVLRRSMSGKHRNRKELDRIIDKFFSNCKNKGISDNIAKEVWRQIDSFAGYSFSKAHSASYAVESFQSLFLKAHYPLEFQVAVINNFGGFYHTWVYFNEARRQGARLNLPCVNNSDIKTNIKGKDVYVGFVHVSNLEHKVQQMIVKERLYNGIYSDLEDFVNRMPAGIEQLILLIKIGALRFTGKTKATLLWDVHMLVNKDQKAPVHNRLFRSTAKEFKLPTLEYNILEDAYDEMEYIGFPLSMTYFDLLKTEFRGELLAKDMDQNIGKKIRIVGQLVTIKKIKTIKKEWMSFGTFLDATGEFFDTTHFPPSLQYNPFKGYGAYLLLGTIVQEFGYATIEIDRMAKLPIQPDPRG